MASHAPQFDLVLAYPQWQGSGRPENLKRGAEAAAKVCAAYGPLSAVADAGPGEPHDGVNRWSAIAAQFAEAQAHLDAAQPERVLTAGGDCACDIAVIDYLHRRHPELSVIWVDAHLDANTPRTSPSGNFHGMPVAALMGHAPEALRPHLGPPLVPAQFRYVSATVGDDGDWVFQKAQGLSWLDETVPICGPVHVHFDLDALDPAEFPHLAYPEGHLSMTAGLTLVHRIAAEADLVGLTVTEFAPADADAAADGAAYIDALCRAALKLA